MNRDRKYQYDPYDEVGQLLARHGIQMGCTKRSGFNQAALARVCGLDEAILNKMLKGKYRGLLYKVIPVMIRRGGFSYREDVIILLRLVAGELDDAKMTNLRAKVDEACDDINLPTQVINGQSQEEIESNSVVSQAALQVEDAMHKQRLEELVEEIVDRRLREMGFIP